MVRLQLATAFVLVAICAADVRIRARARLGRAKEQKEESHRNLHESPAGLCQQATWENRLVVASRYEEDVSWMAAYLVPWMPFLVYSISGDQAATHRTLSNTGREAQAYFQFIVDYYECLPQTVAFIHAHRSSAHSPDMLQDLKRLKWDSIPGFLSLSRPQRVSTFFFDDPEKHRPNPEDTSLGETAHWMEFAYQQNLNMKAAWPQLFDAELGAPPKELTSSCCGQFAVSRERILSHPKSFYQATLRWLQQSDMDSFWAGLIFEQTWSYLLGASTNYTHPSECSVFACDSNGTATVPPVSARRGCQQLLSQ